MKLSQLLSAALIISVLPLLSGCGDGGVQEVKQWMEAIKRDTKVAVPKLSEPKRFAPFIYEAKGTIDPYNSSKMMIALAKLPGGGASNGLKPDENRRREPLESFPLDTVKMVGTLQKPGISYALVQVEKTLYQVKVGNYIGQNFGMVTLITDTEVEMKEIVQDAAGDWVERKAKLELQEKK